MRDAEPLRDEPLRDRRAHPAEDLALLVGDASVDDPGEALEHGRKRRRFCGRSGARADRCLGDYLADDALAVAEPRCGGTGRSPTLCRATIIGEAMAEHRDEVAREVRGSGGGGLHEMNGGIAQAIGDGVVTKCGLDLCLSSELPQRGGEAPVELANGERLVVSHPLQQLLITPRLGARLIRSSLDSHRSRTGPVV
jgi:hypothetical protein